MAEHSAPEYDDHEWTPVADAEGGGTEEGDAAPRQPPAAQ